jgi:hypothetical protein
VIFGAARMEKIIQPFLLQSGKSFDGNSDDNSDGARERADEEADEPSFELFCGRRGFVVATKLFLANVVLDDLVIERLELVFYLVKIIASLNSSVFLNQEIHKDSQILNNFKMFDKK